MVTQGEEKLNTDRTLKWKTTTTTQVKPVRKVSTIHGIKSIKLLREEIVAVDIIENILELPWGVTEPIGKDTTADTKLTCGEEILPSGFSSEKEDIQNCRYFEGCSIRISSERVYGYTSRWIITKRDQEENSRSYRRTI